MTEWIDWVNLVIVIPSVSENKFFLIVTDIIDSRVLVPIQALLILNVWHSVWKFTTWVNFSFDNVENGIGVLFTSKVVHKLGINYFRPL